MCHPWPTLRLVRIRGPYRNHDCNMFYLWYSMWSNPPKYGRYKQLVIRMDMGMSSSALGAYVGLADLTASYKSLNPSCLQAAWAPPLFKPQTVLHFPFKNISSLPRKFIEGSMTSALTILRSPSLWDKTIDTVVENSIKKVGMHRANAIAQI